MLRIFLTSKEAPRHDEVKVDALERPYLEVTGVLPLAYEMSAWMQRVEDTAGLRFEYTLTGMNGVAIGTKTADDATAAAMGDKLDFVSPSYPDLVALVDRVRIGIAHHVASQLATGAPATPYLLSNA